MLTIGCHLSVSKGYLHMAQEAVSIGANTFQFFSRNPRGGNCKPLDEKDILQFRDFAGKNGIEVILAHAPYTMNPCAKEEGLRKFAHDTMLEDLERTDGLVRCMYNFHPGSHVGQGIDAAVDYISDMLNDVLEKYKGDTGILLETMAGKGSEVGRSFEEIERIIEKTEQKNRIGVCMDTCHVWDGGYDIVGDLDGVLDEFDRVIGLDKLCAMHINDSMNILGSHKDRHQKIGEGNIGTGAFERIINNSRLKGIPCYLETPNELPGYAGEIALLKSLEK